MIGDKCFCSFTDVSVPIWGLFNLTMLSVKGNKVANQFIVSVPIWGLFNLTIEIILDDTKGT